MNKSLIPAIVALLVGVVGGYFIGSRNAGGPASGLIGTVNGEAITSPEFLAHVRKKGEVTAIIQGRPVTQVPVAGTVGLLALEDLIKQRIISQMAKDEGVWPSEKDVLDELNLRKEKSPRYVAELNQSGLTLDMIKHGIQLDLAFENLITKGITVTMEDVDKYIQENPNSLIDPAKMSLQFVFVRTDADRGPVDAALSQGQQFGQVAAQFNADPEARSARGVFPAQDVATIKQRLPADVFTKIEATPELRTTEWLKFGDGWAKFYIERKTEARKVEPDQTMKDNMLRQLRIQRGQLANDVGRKVLDRIKTGIREKKIIVEDQGLKGQWDRAAERLLEEDKLSSGTTSGTGEATTTGGAPSTTGSTPPATGGTTGN